MKKGILAMITLNKPIGQIGEIRKGGKLGLEFKLCWSLNNLQPLWAGENLKKSNKIVKPVQSTIQWEYVE